MDNRYPVEVGKDDKKSSVYINKIGGLQGIADGLKTNMKTGIDPKTHGERS